MCREMTVVNRLKGCKKGPQLELKWRLSSTVAQAPADPIANTCSSSPGPYAVWVIQITMCEVESWVLAH